MNTPVLTSPRTEIVYPESDGKPMADNTKQFRYIVTIQGGLDVLFADDPNVLVVGDLLWYPVEGDPHICQAPDVMVVFGRPKGDRGSFKQWVEAHTAPQVVWEILSPNNTAKEMARKFLFYQEHGVQEYYVYDPDRGTLAGYLRGRRELIEISTMQGWTSPLLKVRMELMDLELVLTGPDGRRFRTFVELAQQQEQAQRDKEQAQRDKEQAQRDKEQAQRERDLALSRTEEMARELAALKAKLTAQAGNGQS